ncbi:MAG: hypothetical protein ACRC6X_07815 [Culicoidibacterales bacterium]
MQAYKNLSDYDERKYVVNCVEAILLISFENSYLLTPSDKIELTTSIVEVEHSSLYGSNLNRKFSSKRQGAFIEEASYLATFGKKAYYSSELEYYVNLFIAHNHVHAFYDGNKRTALNFFVDMLYFYTKYKVEDIILIQNAQILYLEKIIGKAQFENVIYNSLIPSLRGHGD